VRTCDLKCKETGKVFKGIHFRHVRPLSTAAAKHHKSQRDSKKKKAKRMSDSDHNMTEEQIEEAMEVGMWRGSSRAADLLPCQ
jgi:hypothetical protein